MTNKNDIKNFLYRSLKDMSGHAMPKKEADSVNIDYILNSYGYRCDEFKNQEILVLGCSQTEGHGLPIELTWPYLVSKKINKEYISLAKGGDGAQAQITKAFKFFEEFYNPKYIFAAFPMARLEVPLINITSKNSIKNDVSIGKGMLSNKLIQKFSKAPHIIEHVLPEEFAIFYNIVFIKMLIQYCNVNNIKLIWTDWRDTNIELPSFKNFHDGYFESFYLDQPIESKCHIEFSDNPFFDYAADYEYWPPGHWNFHKHLHIAESIENML